ncbi:bifunctional diaminohydroxyphosphoribosylaminopyrimidine deaminase/5-amino-6-(5-phosphoribosylamino)uracil reductase RibD [Aliigemmobacter aestuarii]|uniref:Riboflavin biosynthesis protein RibD n=1 Tax=Aliigemmobacter aestuarii TaxID=1445661 RepID=A0A4S3MT98_9RHOB|nr:bifunctional diaminohydroxyphosphoribosylaminopyrimidine deaminase/5-amino-6-(5-phosphoribosylamino)uracil reductase RibD [Gemmobacter aestuarii]THD85826.1 bifunctional diaminohydroxyphosphoribosylaminopyrimidine deaminase/5-amino-6-(5-phosphoribosylamino)uracil reductase RibD [Gemmobacter aestuarii]
MAHALALAARGLGNTWPNPAVGCVILAGGAETGGPDRGRIVGRGFTQPGGRPHAERLALDMAGAAARGGTAYVTLEPCAHHGKTPPCAEALIAAGVARVVTALTDPDPRVAGKGHAMLRAAGIAVTEGVMEDAARRLNAGFLKRVTRGLPFVTLKMAATLDGRIATASGESRWLTGSGARRAVHAMRMRHDAVMVGAGTARADDPDLTVRDIGARHQPVRIVIDSRLAHSPDSRLGRSARDVPIWMLHSPDAPAPSRAAWAATGAELIEVPAQDGRVDLRAALGALAGRGLTRVLCEGGGQLASALVGAGLVDELAVYHAGCLIGAEGAPVLGPLGIGPLADAPRPRLLDVTALGPDALTRWAF